MRAIGFLFWVFLCLLAPFCAQAALSEDSLLKALPLLKSDSDRVNTYNNLFKATFYTSPNRSLKYAEQGLELARSAGYLRGLARISNNIGVWHSKRGNYEAALKHYEDTHEVWEQLGDKNELADCEMNIASVWYKQGKYDPALKSYQQALQTYRQLGDTIRCIDAINNIGTVYLDQGNYSPALEAFLLALQLREKEGDQMQLAVSFANVGLVYQMEGLYEEAMVFYRKGHRQSILAGDKFGQTNALNNIADIYLARSQWDSASVWLRASLGMASEMEDKFAMATSYLGLARVYEAESDLDSANLAYDKALEICRAIGRQQGEALALSKIGEAKLRQRDFMGAIAAFQSSLAITQDIQAKDLSAENHRHLAVAFASMTSFESAYRHLQNAMNLKDTLYTAEKSKQMASLQNDYSFKSKQEEINRLKLKQAEDQLSIEKSATRNLVLLSILLPLCLLAIVLYLRFKRNKRIGAQFEQKNIEIQKHRDRLEAQNNQIKEINSGLERMVATRTQAVSDAKKELDTFLYESTHALRRPLLRVESLVGLIEQEPDPMAREALRERLGRTLGDMDHLLHKLVAVNEAGNRRINLEHIHVKELMEELFDELPSGLSLKLRVEEIEALNSDRYLLAQMLLPLLENAAESYDEENQEKAILVTVSQDEAFVFFQIEDQGAGIPADQMAHVFEMFHRGTNKLGSHGLGLYLSRKIVQLLHGKIELQSELGKGTTVKIELPRHEM